MGKEVSWDRRGGCPCSAALVVPTGCTQARLRPQDAVCSLPDVQVWSLEWSSLSELNVRHRRPTASAAKDTPARPSWANLPGSGGRDPIMRRGDGACESAECGGLCHRLESETSTRLLCCRSDQAPMIKPSHSPIFLQPLAYSLPSPIDTPTSFSVEPGPQSAIQ